MTVRHFLTLSDLKADELQKLLARAVTLKKERQDGRSRPERPGRVLAMIFEKSSTRTRVSFETAMIHLGGGAVFLTTGATHIGRGEPVEDTARVLSGMVDGVVLRTHSHAVQQRFAEYSSVPVINGLSDVHHPCQLLADMQTYLEHRGDIAGRRVAWLGDGNNVCHSYIEAARLLDFELAIACPDGYRPSEDILGAGGGSISVTSDAEVAVAGAHLVVTDVWTSMGQESEAERRLEVFKPFQVNAALMRQAAPDALFMHCLPAHRGEEVTADVIESPASVVWDEAENRLHAQKALLEFLMR